MGFAKRKQELTAAEHVDCLRSLHVSGTDLKALVTLTQELIAEELERKVTAAKASRDGASLPVELLRRQIVGLPTEAAYNCECRAALRWSDE